MIAVMTPRELITAARARAGLTQAALARLAGTSQPAVARYENGHAEPSISTLSRLVEACGERLLLAAEGKTLTQAQRHALRGIAAAHGAANVRLFGSFARGEQRPDSDVDVLVDLRPDGTLLDLLAIESEASEVLGRTVEVTTPNLLRSHAREGALRDAVPA